LEQWGTGVEVIQRQKPGLSPRSGIFEGPVQDPALRGSELNGFAGKDCEFLWRFQVSGVRKKNIEAET
jgi:hypothetical protein